MSIISKLKVWIGSDTSELDRGLRKSKKNVSTFGKSMEKIGGIIATTFAVDRLVAFGRQAMELAKVQHTAEKNLEATIRATGKAAGFTADELKKYASELQGVTTIGDETTIANMAVLTSFSRIKGTVFKETVKAAQDMSTVLQQDMKESIQLLGKALNDPLKGMRTLRRVGISLTADQIAKIHELIDAGKMEEAQWMILTEVQHRYGGAAREAASDAYGAITQLSNAWGDYKEAFGDAIRPSKEGMNELTEIVNYNTAVLNDETIPAWKKWLGMIVPRLARANKTQAALNQQRKDANAAMIEGMKLSEKGVSDLLAERAALFALGAERRKYYQEAWDAIQRELDARTHGVDAVTAEQKAEQAAAAERQKAEEDRQAAIQDAIHMEEKTISGIGEKIKAFNKLKESVDITDQASLDYFNREVGRLKYLQSEIEKMSNQRLLDAAHKRDGGVITPIEQQDTGALAQTSHLADLPEQLEKIDAAYQQLEEDMINLGPAIESGIGTMVSGIGESIGMLVAGEGTLNGFAAAVGSTFADMAINVGKTAIQTGIAVLGIKAALKSLNPFAAIAAGAALVALGTAMKAKLSGIADSGGGGGTFSSHAYGGGNYDSVGTSRMTELADNREKTIVVQGQLVARGSELVAVIDSENNRRSYTR